jgi:hypothetical protein
MRYSLSKHALVESSTLNPGRRSGEKSDKGARSSRQYGNRATMLLNVKTRRARVVCIADGKVVMGIARCLPVLLSSGYGGLVACVA